MRAYQDASVISTFPGAMINLSRGARRVIAQRLIKRYAAGKLNRKWKVVKVRHSSRARGSDGG